MFFLIHKNQQTYHLLLILSYQSFELILIHYELLYCNLMINENHHLQQQSLILQQQQLYHHCLRMG